MNKTWHVVVAFFVVFLAGGAIGTIYELRYGPKLPANPSLPQPEQFNPQLTRRWVNKELNLTPAQREKVLPAVRDAAEDLRRLRNEASHSAELILEHMQDEIAAVLTPAQRERFTELIERNREQMRQFNLQRGRQLLQQRQAQDGAAAAGN